MRLFLTFTFQVLGRCDLTRGSRRGGRRRAARRRPPTANHARPPFTEKKRYPIKQRRFGDVGYQKDVSVYQTYAVLILLGGVQRALGSRGLATTKQFRVRRCSKDRLLRS